MTAWEPSQITKGAASALAASSGIVRIGHSRVRRRAYRLHPPQQHGIDRKATPALLIKGAKCHFGTVLLNNIDWAFGDAVKDSLPQTHDSKETSEQKWHSKPHDLAAVPAIADEVPLL